MTPFAKEYGEALFSLAMEENLIERMHDEVLYVNQCFLENPEFVTLLESRAVPETERLGILDEVFVNQVHPYLINFLKILCGRHALSFFSDIAAYIHRSTDEHFGISEAHVTTAEALSTENVERIKTGLERKTGRKIRLIEHVDPSVMGGVRVEVDGQCMDNTIATRLENMREHLIESL